MAGPPYTVEHDELVRALELLQLASVASSTAIKRGVMLHHLGRVEHIAPASDGSLLCIVHGYDGGRSEVRSKRAGDSFTVVCSCHHGGECEHVVATVIRARELAPMWRKTLRKVRAPASETPAGPPKDDAGLATWIADHGVEDVANTISDHFADYVNTRDPRYRDMVQRLRYNGGSVSAIITQGVSWLTAPAPLRELARSYLAERAEVRREHGERVREQRWPAPTDPRLAPHLASLLAVREQLLGTGVSSRPPDERQDSKHTAEMYPTQIHVDAPIRHNWYAGTDRTTVALHHDGTVDLAATIPGHRGGPLAIEALELTAHLLTSPDNAKLAARLAHELSIPPWRRLVDELGSSIDAPGPAADFEVGWRLALRGRLGHASIVPVACVPKARGGWKIKQLTSEQWGVAQQNPTHPGDSVGFAAYVVEQSVHGDEEAQAATLSMVLPALIGHPHFYLRDGRDIPLRLVRGHLALATSDREGGFRVGFDVDGRFWTAAAIRAAATRIQIDGAVLLFDDEAETATLCALTPALAKAIRVAARHSDVMPSEATKPFVEVALKARQAMPLAVSEGLRGPSTPADARLRVRLSLVGDALTIAAVVKPSEDLASEVPGEGPHALYLEREGALVAVERDLMAERAAAQKLWGVLGLAPAADFVDALPIGDAAMDLIRDLGQHSEVEVEWSGKERVAVTQALQIDALRLEARSGKGRTWFALHGEAGVEGGGAVPLPELLRAIRERQRYVRVDGERWAEIDKALMRKMSALAKRDGKVPTLMAPLVAELEDAGAELVGFAALNQSLRRLRDARGLVVATPSGLHAELRPYQREGFQWLARLATWATGACLADDMGLGKTVQALALMLHRSKEGPALVVAPTSLGFNWAREAERFAPSLRVRITRSGTELAELGAVGPGDVVITSYGLVARHVERLAAVAWGTLVVDEAQTVKNAATLRARTLRELTAGFCLALTGTPVENRASELWSLFRLVAPGLLGSEAGFREDFAAPIERGDEVARAGLAALIAPFVLRRLKRDVAQDLPPRTEVELEVVLKKAERARYEEIRKATLHLLDGADGTPPQQRRFKALQALTRLRQLACHPGLLDPHWADGSAKLDALEGVVTRLREEGHRALVFSQFTSFLAKVRERLDAMAVSYLYLDGQTSPTERQVRVDAFQAGAADVFLLSLKAGGTGLNLTAATYVIHLDPWWNPAVEDQATDRTHRIGQDQPVTVYRLIAKDTVEEGIVQLHGEKRELADALLAGTGSSATLSYDEMLALISGASPELALVDDDDDGDDVAALADVAGAGEPDEDERPRPAKVIDLAAARAQRKPRSPAPPAAPAPEVPATLQVAPAPPHTGANEVEDRFVRAIARAADAGEIARSTAGTYRSAGRRYIAFAADRGRDATLEATLEAYLKAIEDGTVKASKSQIPMARAAFKWIRDGQTP